MVYRSYSDVILIHTVDFVELNIAGGMKITKNWHSFFINSRTQASNASQKLELKASSYHCPKRHVLLLFGLCHPPFILSFVDGLL